MLLVCLEDEAIGTKTSFGLDYWTTFYSNRMPRCTFSSYRGGIFFLIQDSAFGGVGKILYDR